jgi:hypothetical protein
LEQLRIQCYTKMAIRFLFQDKIYGINDHYGDGHGGEIE